jgi:signal transduction histidine kinase
MQEQGVRSMERVGAEAPFGWAASWTEADGQPAADLLAVSTLWANKVAALERAQALQAESLMMLVHELRAPAAAAKSMVAIERYLNRVDPQLDHFLAKIEGRMDQLLELVDDILDLSQAKAGRPLGQATVLDLVAETRTVCEPYQEEAAAKKVAMHVELPESKMRVRLPAKAYQLIVSNLVSNAVKYTTSGSIRVTLRRQGAWAVLTVEDTGMGIPAHEIRHLFTEFFRASNARASCAPGTGLGLAAVKTLVEGCHGKLALQSRENRGSRFTVRLPLCQADVTPGSLRKRYRRH